ncbi:MAG: hypothetical protein LUH07_00660 [Lachnospiraceae bacterium]|nr:hypothetical protein [Lachnospiraceae bacterium]
MINILYCGDRNIEDGLIISVLSLLKNVTEELNILVMTLSLSKQEADSSQPASGTKETESQTACSETESAGRQILPVTEETIQYLDLLVKEANPENRVSLIDATELFLKQIPAANMDTRFTPCCMLRLYADQIPDMPERVLYLDNDVVCRRNFGDFYHQEMENEELAGVLDYYGSWFFRRNLFHRDYLNSGVLLLNMKKIRETGLFQRCRSLCETKKMFMPDQSAINKLAEHKKICNRQYNDQRRFHEDTVMQHFSTTFRFFPRVRTLTVKPWEVEKVHSVLKLHEYDDLLAEYIGVKAGMQSAAKEAAC